MSSECAQASVAAEQISLQENRGDIAAVIEVAFQPTARGGSTHFPSGNGRIVLLARQILDDSNPKCTGMYAARKAERELDPNFDGDVTWKERTWIQIMLESIGLKENQKDKNKYEQLIIRDQQMFTCPLCKNMLL